MCIAGDDFYFNEKKKKYGNDKGWKYGKNIYKQSQNRRTESVSSINNTGIDMFSSPFKDQEHITDKTDTT